MTVIKCQMVPLERWPGVVSDEPERGSFRVDYDKLLAELDDELWRLSAEGITLQISLTKAQIKRWSRQDGWPLTDTNPMTPGVIVSFAGCYGPQQFQADHYAHWKANLRGITLTLAALRAINRYGAVKIGQQYRGWDALASSYRKGWAASQHILRIEPEPGKGHTGYIAAFLTTPYGQHQLASKIYGGVIDELTEGDTAAVWIPNAPAEVQEAIGQKVVRAYEKKDEAADIEAAVILALEARLEGKATVKTQEGQEPQGWQDFKALAKGVFSVPKSELDAQIKADNKRARKRGLVNYRGDDKVALTDAGAALARPSSKPPTLAGLHRSWLNRLGKAEAAFVTALIPIYPKAYSVDSLATKTGYSPTSSTVGATIRSLEEWGLVERPQSGVARATDLLFPKGLV